MSEKRIAAGTAGVLVALLLVGASCDKYLDVTQVNQSTTDNYYQNDEQLEKAIAAAYSAFGNRGLYGWYYHTLRGAMEDDCGTAEAGWLGDAYRFGFDPTESGLYDAWGSLYEAVFRSNIVLEKAPGAEWVKDETLRRTVIGEAYFLRALAYWHLVTMWGEVPLVLEAYPDDYGIAKSSVAAIWQQVEADLTQAIAYLPATPRNPGRATIGAARALMGKALLYQEKFAAAADSLKKVVDDPQYGLAPLEHVWTVAGENGEENIFEIQFSKTGENPFYDDGGSAAEGAMRNVFLGPGQWGGWENLFPSQSLVDAFEPTDPRKAAFIWSHGDTITMVGWGGPAACTFDSSQTKSTYATKCNIRKGMGNSVAPFWPGGFEENSPVIRYADVLLMYAECLVKVGAGDWKTPVNQVRERAWGSSSAPGYRDVDQLMTDSGWTDPMQAIKHERRVELCFENHRFNDLVRWGDAPTALAGRYRAERKYLPIPQLDIARSGGALKQNPNY